MPDILQQLFGLICGQDPAHTWAPGGMPLPFCQRCTGLYVGSAIAACLHWRGRPKLTGHFLELHGAFLLLMLPFGFHWLPQGGLLRTLTGVLFGFGIVTYLWLPAAWGASSQVQQTHAPGSFWAYILGLVCTLVFLTVAAISGGTLAGYIIVLVAILGLVALLMLLGANVALAVRVLWRWSFSHYFKEA